MTGGRQVPAAEVNHAAFEHEQLKQWTDDADPGASQAVAEQWTQTGAALMDAADQLKRASTESEAGWTGVAADAMRERLGQIYQWSSRTGSQIADSSQSIVRQGEVSDTARHAMPEPVPYDPAQMIRDAGQGGLLAMAALPQQLVAQKHKHDAAHEEAIRVVAERDSAMSAAAGAVPVFEPPPALDESAGERTFVGSADVGGVDGGAGGSGPRTVAGPGAGGGPEPAGGSAPGGGFGGGSAGATPHAGASAGNGPARLGGTSPEAFTPAASVPGGATGFGSAPIPQQGGGSSGAGGGFVPVGGGTGAAGGSGTRAGAEAAARSAGGARGAGAMGGMPLGGAGRREDDAEHRRPEFLQEPDPDGIFDTGVHTAPSVIGGPDGE